METKINIQTILHKLRLSSTAFGYLMGLLTVGVAVTIMGMDVATMALWDHFSQSSYCWAFVFFIGLWKLLWSKKSRDV